MKNEASNLKNLSPSHSAKQVSQDPPLHLSNTRVVKTNESQIKIKINKNQIKIELNNEDLNQLPLNDRLYVEKFIEWLENKKEWWVVLEREDVEGTRYYLKDFKFFRVYNRFDKQYVKKVIKKFSVLSLFAEDHSFVHIVLTVEGGSISDNIALLRRNWNRLRALFKKRLGRNYPFVAVLEPQKQGQPHMHILLFTEKFVMDQRELSNWCQEHGLGKVVWIRRYWAHGSRKKPIWYLSKYLSKQYKKDSWSFWDFVFYACVWFWKAKLYTFSRDIKFPKRKKLIGWRAFVLSYEQLIVLVKTNVELHLWSFSLPLEYYTWNLDDKVKWFYDVL